RVSEDRPSINATLDIGGMPIRFVGVHPTPPALAKRSGTGRHNSRIRDAELVLVAEDVAADAEAVWIVAGDFNDVAWSHTTRLFRRLSGLRDPRVGRGMFSTYHAEYPLLRYPLDHVFVSRGIRVAGLSRVRMPGSDHFAMLADLDLRDVGEGVNPTADPDDLEEAAEVIDEGTEDAEDMGRSTP
ncbi:MAG: endonuclease/exonuclease/phosphatase family protein, partial [Planctomycetota bacterium]